MNIFDAILQAIVQGLTEFLPVSSSGHLSLVQHFTGKNLEGAQSFTIFLHMGTLVAVFIVYRQLILDLILEAWSMIKDLFGRKLSWKIQDMSQSRRMVIMLIVATACAAVLFLPIFGVFGIQDNDGEKIKSMSNLSTYVSEDNDIVVEGVCLMLTGVLLLYATWRSKQPKHKTTDKLEYKHALAMGFGQCAAVLPGLSRSGTTTTLGMITGLEKNTALNFSFIMSIPAVLAANVMEIRHIDWGTFEPAPAIIGIIIAGAVGVASIMFLKWIVSGNKLHYFGYYCLGAGFIVTVLGIIEHVRGYAFRFALI